MPEPITRKLHGVFLTASWVVLDMGQLVKHCQAAAEAAGATVCQTGTKRFSGGGLSVTFILAESHLACHIWPNEAGENLHLVEIDISTCGHLCKPILGFEYLLGAFGAIPQIYVEETEYELLALVKAKMKEVLS